MSSPFRFKQFTVHHDQCQMKVGTDGVLIGALAKPEDAANLLDIGTGSGLIALMMAQKCEGHITGIDIDQDSIAQARENVQHSPWASRIEMIHASVQEFSKQQPAVFDLIISNPPFFSQSLRSPEPGKNRAKHDADLTYSELLSATSVLLRPEGKACFIIPADARTGFLQIAESNGLQPASETTIFPKVGKAAHRCFLQLVKGKAIDYKVNELYIRDEAGGLTDSYKQVCSAFYLD